MAVSLHSGRAIWLFVGFSAYLWSCHLAQPKTEEYLEWNLPDSLATFDWLEIVVLDATDTSLVLESVYSGKLASIRDLQPYILRDAAGKEFHVRIRGFRSGQLAYQTTFTREGDAFLVRKTDISKVKVQNPDTSRPPKDSTPVSIPAAQPLLKSLSVFPGSLTPGFSPALLEYRTALAFSDSSVRVTAMAGDSLGLTLGKDTLVSGVSSRSISLQLGEDTLRVAVYTPNKTKTTIYRILTKRAVSAEARLRSLGFSDSTVTIVFDPDLSDYSITVADSIDSLALLPKAMDGKAEIKVNGNQPGSNGAFPPLALKTGSNLVEVSVVAPDGVTRKTYKVTLFRKASSNAYLSTLTISPGSFTKVFQRDRLLYNANAPAGQTEINVVAVPEDPSASVQVNNQRAQGSVPVRVPLTGTTTIVNVVVSAADGATTNAYFVTISVKPASTP